LLIVKTHRALAERVEQRGSMKQLKEPKVKEQSKQTTVGASLQTKRTNYI
jgi:hypothetical protein